MTEEIAKQMTWHKNGKRYSLDKMVHPSGGKAWKFIDQQHRSKSDEARNVRVALATDGFNLYGMLAVPYTLSRISVRGTPTDVHVEIIHTQFEASYSTLCPVTRTVIDGRSLKDGKGVERIDQGLSAGHRRIRK